MRIPRGDFEFLPHYCLYCGQQIPLYKKFIRSYICRGFPKYHKGCQWIGRKRPNQSISMKLHNPMKRPEIVKKVKLTYELKFLNTENKIQAVIKNLEKKRLELISKEPVKEDKQEPLKIDPNKKRILCPIQGHVFKTCFKKHCKEYDFCHRVEPKKVKIVEAETDYSSRIKQLNSNYSAEQSANLPTVAGIE